MTATPAAPARMQSAALAASTPPIATTGTATAAQISRRPSRPIAGSASVLDGVSRPGPRRCSPPRPPRRALPRRSMRRARAGARVPWRAQTLRQSGRGALRPPQHQRSVDVVVHDERDTVTRTEAPRRAAPFDDIDAWHVLEPPLDHRRSTFDREPRGLELVDECVQPHEIRARPSSVSGSSAASAS